MVDIKILSLVPRETASLSDYYAATDKKHFGGNLTAGSKFLDPNLTKIEDLLNLALNQRGNLDGDDRDKFIKLGADPTSFSYATRYLYVETPGTLGVKNAGLLNEKDLLRVERTKIGSACSFVLEVEKQETVNYGVIVITKNRDTGEDMVLTVFPGHPIKSVKNSNIDELEGTHVTVEDARKLSYRDDFWVNTKLITKRG